MRRAARASALLSPQRVAAVLSDRSCARSATHNGRATRGYTVGWEGAAVVVTHEPGQVFTSLADVEAALLRYARSLSSAGLAVTVLPDRLLVTKR